jgi:hypothetical protein
MKRLLTISFVLIIVASLGRWLAFSSPPDTTSVNVFRNGSTVRLDANASAFRSVCASIPHLFEDPMYGVYEPGSQYEWTHSGTSVEVSYNPPLAVILRRSFSDEVPLRIDRILVNLTPGHKGWILLSVDGQYGTAPYITTASSTIESLYQLFK